MAGRPHWVILTVREAAVPSKESFPDTGSENLLVVTYTGLLPQILLPLNTGRKFKALLLNFKFVYH